MTVIFGVKENARIIIAADNRLVNADRVLVNDSADKIVVINDRLAIACAGSAVVERLIDRKLSEATERDSFTTDDVKMLIFNLFEWLNKQATGISKIALDPFCCLIGGESGEGNAKLICVLNRGGKLTAKEGEMFMCPPCRDIRDKCCEILFFNLTFHKSIFVERTIWEVAEISDLVSHTGRKWIYDAENKYGYGTSF